MSSKDPYRSWDDRRQRSSGEASRRSNESEDMRGQNDRRDRPSSSSRRNSWREDRSSSLGSSRPASSSSHYGDQFHNPEYVYNSLSASRDGVAMERVQRQQRNEDARKQRENKEEWSNCAIARTSLDDSDDDEDGETGGIVMRMAPMPPPAPAAPPAYRQPLHLVQQQQPNYPLASSTQQGASCHGRNTQMGDRLDEEDAEREAKKAAKKARKEEKKEKKRAKKRAREQSSDSEGDEEASLRSCYSNTNKEWKHRDPAKRSRRDLEKENMFGKAKSSKPLHLLRREDWPCIDNGENQLDLSDLVLIDQKWSERTEMDPSKVPEYTRLDCSKRRPWLMRHYGQDFDTETMNEHRVVERRYREVYDQRDGSEDDFIPISDEPLPQLVNPIEHFGLEEEVGEQSLPHFRRLQRLPTASWFEAGVIERDELLRAKLFLEPLDGSKWVELSRLQRQLRQLQDFCNPAGATVDLKGIYLARESVLRLNKRTRDNFAAVEWAKINKLDLDQLEIEIELVRAEEEWKWDKESRGMRALRWKSLEGLYPIRSTFWRAAISHWQSDSRLFTLKDTLARIDRCISTYADANAHAPILTETDERFIADLIEHRYRLLWEAGFKRDVVKAVQILGEYHFFRPRQLGERNEVLRRLEKYWVSSDAPRLGEPNAKGWSSFDPKSDFKSDRTKQSTALKAEVIQLKEQHDMEAKDSFRLHRCNEAELWLTLEESWERYAWNPLHHLTPEIEADDRSWPHNVGSTLFYDFVADEKLAEDLVLRLLGLMGAVVPGLADEKDPEFILRSLSSQLFPPLIKQDCWGLSDFLVNFLRQLAKSTKVKRPDVIRLKAAALLTHAKFHLHSPKLKSDAERIQAGEALHVLLTKLTSQQGEHEYDASLESALLVYYLVEAYHATGVPQLVASAMQMAFTSLRGAIKALTRGTNNLWHPDGTDEAGRLVCLKLAHFLLHRLPYTEDRGELDHNEADGGVVSMEWSKLEFLTQLALNGNIDATRSYMTGKAKDSFLKEAAGRWRDRIRVTDKNIAVDSLSGVGTSIIGSWFGSNYAILLDLASTFFHEASDHQADAYRKCMFESELGRLVIEHGVLEAIQTLTEALARCGWNKQLLMEVFAGSVLETAGLMELLDKEDGKGIMHIACKPLEIDSMKSERMG